MTRSDVLHNKLTGVTKRLMKPPHQPPEAHPFIQDTEGERDSAGMLKWRNAISNAEELEGTRQKHTDWTNTAGEKKNVHYCRVTDDRHGNVIQELIPDIPPPIGEQIEDLTRGKGFYMSDPDTEKYTSAHNPATASVFRAAKQNTAFLYKYQVSQNDMEINFPEFREQFYRDIKDPPGKAKHQSFHMAILGRAPPQYI